MSYTVDGDGQIRYACKTCQREQTTRSLKSLPKGWFISGILKTAFDPEVQSQDEAASKQTDLTSRLMEAGEMVGMHFCRIQCARQFFKDAKVRDKIIEMKVSVGVYGKCELMVDGARAGEPEEDPEEGTTRGSPPPFQMGEGGGGF